MSPLSCCYSVYADHWNVNGKVRRILTLRPTMKVGDEAKNTFCVKLIIRPQMNYCLLRRLPHGEQREQV